MCGKKNEDVRDEYVCFFHSQIIYYCLKRTEVDKFSDKNINIEIEYVFTL